MIGPKAEPRRKPLEDEISEFLRRAAERQRPARPESRPASSPRPAARPPSPRAPAQPVEAAIATARPTGADVDAHVRRYLDADEFTRRSAEMGDRVAQADSQTDERLHEVFDHRLGQLQERLPQEAAEVPRTAVQPIQLLALLSRPETVRNAVVLSEILQRPQHRWT